MLLIVCSPPCIAENLAFHYKIIYIIGYQSDVTRTFHYGTAPPREQAIWELVQKAQAAGFFFFCMCVCLWVLLLCVKVEQKQRTMWSFVMHLCGGGGGNIKKPLLRCDRVCELQTSMQPHGRLSKRKVMVSSFRIVWGMALDWRFTRFFFFFSWCILISLFKVSKIKK